MPNNFLPAGAVGYLDLGNQVNWCVFNINQLRGNLNLLTSNNNVWTGTQYFQGAIEYNISTKTSNYNVQLSDGTILVNTTSGAVTITLPSASSATGLMFDIKLIAGTNNLIINTVSGNIDGSSSITTNTTYAAYSFQSDGSNYWIL